MDGMADNVRAHYTGDDGSNCDLDRRFRDEQTRPPPTCGDERVF
jgi:hypothetical protein